MCLPREFFLPMVRTDSGEPGEGGRESAFTVSAGFPEPSRTFLVLFWFHYR